MVPVKSCHCYITKNVNFPFHCSVWMFYCARDWRWTFSVECNSILLNKFKWVLLIESWISLCHHCDDYSGVKLWFATFFFSKATYKSNQGFFTETHNQSAISYVCSCLTAGTLRYVNNICIVWWYTVLTY